MSPAERHALQAGQAAIWRHDIGAAVRILFDAVAPELKHLPLSTLFKVVELSGIIRRAAHEQLVSTLPQSLKKLALNDVECPTLFDNDLFDQIKDDSAYCYADQFLSAPRADEVGPSRGRYRDGYETIDSLLRLLRIYAILSDRKEFFGLSEEELGAVLKRVEPVLAHADPRAFAMTREVATSPTN